MSHSAIGAVPPLTTRLAVLAGLVALVTATTLVWRQTSLGHYFTPENIAPLLQEVRGSGWTIPVVVGIYILGNLIFFPLTIMIITTSLAFPPLEAFALALTGSVISAIVGYGIGRWAGPKPLHFIMGQSAGKISRFAHNAGIVGVAVLRMLPLAPLGLVDFALGIAKTPFLTYLAGTLLGLLPGIIVLSLLGTSLGSLWHNRSPFTVLYVGLGLAAWIGIVVASHFAMQRWQPKPDPDEANA